jgi:hypothetical protein
MTIRQSITFSGGDGEVQVEIDEEKQEVNLVVRNLDKGSVTLVKMDRNELKQFVSDLDHMLEG